MSKMTTLILGNAPSAEETDPETKCQNKCGKNEVCQIFGGGREITCKCRPGFGKARPGSSCESMYANLGIYTVGRPISCDIL